MTNIFETVRTIFENSASAGAEVLPFTDPGQYATLHTAVMSLVGEWSGKPDDPNATLDYELETGAWAFYDSVTMEATRQEALQILSDHPAADVSAMFLTVAERTGVHMELSWGADFIREMHSAYRQQREYRQARVFSVSLMRCLRQSGMVQLQPDDRKQLLEAATHIHNLSVYDLRQNRERLHGLAALRERRSVNVRPEGGLIYHQPVDFRR